MWGQFEAHRATLATQYQTDRWRHGADEATLRAGIDAIMNSSNDVGHNKAKAIAFLLCNAPLDICEAEFFADKLGHFNIMQEWSRTLRTRVQARNDCAATTALCLRAKEVRAFEATMDFGHIGPDWAMLLQNGFSGILGALREHRSTASPQQQAFYDNCITVWEAILTLMERMAVLCDEMGGEHPAFMAKNLRFLATSAPQSLAQAMQLTLLFYRLATHLDCTIVRTLGGLDRLYEPFYRRDLESGAFTEAQLRELTADFLWKISAMGVTANMPFYLCGKKEDGSDATNDYTFVLLEEYRQLNVADPKIHVMYHNGLDRRVTDFVLKTIREGKNSFLFLNTDVAAKALEKIGIDKQDAARVTVYGCYEPAAEGTEVPATCGGKINLAKAVELALFNGEDHKTNGIFSLQTGRDFATFEDFITAVEAQLSFSLDACMGAISHYEKYYPLICPSPVLSPTLKSSLARGVDLYAGGAKYNNTSIVCAGLATLVDSLAALRQLVFEEKVISYSDLCRCLKNDWQGQERLRRICLHRTPKYGNNDPRADDLTARIIDFLACKVNGRSTGRGGVFRLGLFSIDWRFAMGRATAATPDGRRRGDPLSKNTTATIGMDKKGITALLSSNLRIDGECVPDGYVADVILHTSAVKGDDGLAAFLGLLTAYMRAGGLAIHFNVLNAEVLKQAQLEPEKHKNLQIRLCGWNVYFVDLTKQEQDEFILNASAGE